MIWDESWKSPKYLHPSSNAQLNLVFVESGGEKPAQAAD
jgi:hypothetical protein